MRIQALNISALFSVHLDIELLDRTYVESFLKHVLLESILLLLEILPRQDQTGYERRQSLVPLVVFHGEADHGAVLVVEEVFIPQQWELIVQHLLHNGEELHQVPVVHALTYGVLSLDQGHLHGSDGEVTTDHVHVIVPLLVVLEGPI